ncbi:MAG TPA: MASE1 domain-containing protein, partial [Anaerolineae bacterium]|nr:MASE1 domain-containing protein [Anaerolineae bacterium]
MYLEATTPTSKKIAALILFTLLYFAGIPLGNAFLTEPGYSTAFWPNSGLFLAALLLSDYRLWAPIILAVICAETAGNIVVGDSGLRWDQTALIGISYGVINALDVFIAAFLLRYHWPAPLDLSKLKDLLGLVVLGMAAGSAIGATLGAEFLTGMLYPGIAYWDAWQGWFLSDGLGLVIVAPALLSWISPNRQKLRRPSWHWSLEFALLLISLIIVAQLVFAPDTVSHTLVFYFPFALYPVLIWTAVRFSHRTVTVVLLIMATLLSQEVLLGIGPFFVLAQAGQIIILLLQAFLMVTVVSTLALSAVITERKQAETALRRYADRLEVLHDIDQAILGGRSPQAIAQAAVGHLRRLVAVRQAGVVEFDELTNQATLLAAKADHQVEFTENCQLSIAQFGRVEQLRQGQVNVVTGVQAAAPPLLRAPGVDSLVIVPLRVQNQLIGCLNLGAGEPQALPAESLAVAREIAAQVAIAIQQARLQSQVLQYTDDLEQRVADRVRELSVLYEVTRVLSEALDMETVLSR